MVNKKTTKQKAINTILKMLLDGQRITVDDTAKLLGIKSLHSVISRIQNSKLIPVTKYMTDSKEACTGRVRAVACYFMTKDDIQDYIYNRNEQRERQRKEVIKKRLERDKKTINRISNRYSIKLDIEQ